MGIELIPADDFGEMAGPIDHTEIELREGLVRRIQRDSEAADARTWAFSRSAIAGRYVDACPICPSARSLNTTPVIPNPTASSSRVGTAPVHVTPALK